MGLSCEKDFTLHIDPATSCPDWVADLVWPYDVPFDPYTTAVPPATASVSGANDAFSLAVTGNIGPIPYAQASCGNSGSLTYNGTGCNCNLNLQIIRAGDGSDIDAGTVRVYIDGGATLCTYSWSVAPLNTGTSVDIPFVLPDTAGLDVIVVVDFSIATVQPPPWMIPVSMPTSYSAVGQVTNV